MFVDTFDMNVDDAFPQRAGNGLCTLERGEPAGAVAQHAEDRMHDQVDIDTALGEFGQHRVHQEWHVVIHDFEHGIDAQPVVTRQGGRVEANVRHAGFAHGEQRPSIRGELGKLTRIVTHEIFGNSVSKERDDEILRHIAIAATQDVGGCSNERRFGAFFVRAGKVVRCHRVVPRRAPRVTLNPDIIAKGFRSQNLHPQVLLTAA